MTRTVLSPQQMRERLVASYLDSHQRAGIPHTVQEIERLVVADCELVDAARRSGELGPGRPVARRDPKPDNRERLAKAVATSGNGARLVSGEVERVRSPLIHGQVDERWSAARARLKRILEGAAKTNTLAGAVAGAEYKVLAMQYAEQWALYMARVPFPHACGAGGCAVGPTPEHPHQPGNPYCRLTDLDADRMFRRVVEDICDRSTGVLGSWSVK